MTIKNTPLHPWKRYIARTFDLFFYNVFVTTIISLVFQISIVTQNQLLRVFYFALSTLMMIFLEPFLLQKFGTTLGKFVLGIRVKSAEGRRLSYNEALDRTWDILLRGMGFNIPIIGWILLAKSYKRCINNRKQEWDEEIMISIKEINCFRIIVMTMAFVATAAVIIIVSFAQGLPPNRGNLTVEQFSQNYNYYVNLYKSEPRTYRNYQEMTLKSDGTWALFSEPESVPYDTFYQHPPVLMFDMKDGYIQTISAEVIIEEKQTHITDYNEFMILSTIAFVGAQKETELFSNFLVEIEEKITKKSFETFYFKKAEVTVDNEVDRVGYVEMSDCLTPDEESPTFYYRQDFTITKGKEKENMPQSSILEASEIALKSNVEPSILEIDWSEYFGGLNGAAVFYTPFENQFRIYNYKLATTRRSPCSTFKIISSLIGIEKGIILKDNSQRKWSGEIFWKEEWNKDINFEEAFTSSCVWYFREVINDIGLEIMQKELDKLQYGNCDISDWEGHLNTNNSNRALTGFWIESSLKISPKEQTEVMMRIFDEKEGYKEESLEELKRAMIVHEQEEVEYSVYGKTGTGKIDGITVDSWFTGFVETKDGNVFFSVYLGETEGKEVSSVKAKEIALALASDIL